MASIEKQNGGSAPGKKLSTTVEAEAGYSGDYMNGNMTTDELRLAESRSTSITGLQVD